MRKEKQKMYGYKVQAMTTKNAERKNFIHMNKSNADSQLREYQQHVADKLEK